MSDVNTPPKRWPQWLGFSLIALILTGFVLQDRHESHKNIASSEVARLQTLARLSEASLAAHLIAIDQMMREIRGQQLLLLQATHSRPAKPATQTLQSLAAAIPGARTVSLTDAAGTFVASSRPELVGVNAAHRAYFQKAQATRDPQTLIISEPFQTRLNVFSIQLVRPLMDRHGKFQGAVAVTLDPSFFETLLNTSMYASDLRCLLIHEDGVVFQAAGDFTSAPGINLDKPGSLLSIHKNSGQLESLINNRSYSTGDSRIGVLRTLHSDKLSTDKKLILTFTRNTEALFAVWRTETWQLTIVLASLLAMGAVTLAVHQRRERSAWRAAQKLQAARLTAERLQAQSAHEIEDLYDHAPCGYHSLDAQGFFARINQTELDWLGLTREAVVGKLRFIDLLSPEEAGKFSAVFPKFQASGRIENVEFTLKDKHGQNLVILVNATAVKDADGKFLFSRTTLSDITLRKRLEMALKDKSDQLESILNNASIGIYMLRERKLVWANPVVCALFGYTFDEIVGQSINMLYPTHEQYQSAGQEIYPELDAGKTVVRDVEFKRKDGAIIWARATLKVVERQTGELETIVLIEDITQRKQAERTNRELICLIEESPDFIATAGLDKVVSYMNPAGLKMLGYPAGTLARSIRIAQAHPDWVNEKLKNEVFPTAHAEGSWRGELAMRDQQGHEIPVFQTVLLHRDERGQPSHLSTIVRDISSQKNAEKILLQAKLAAEEANRAKSQFISNMSHDIRTPLSALLTYGHLLEDASLSPKHRDQLKRLNLAGDTLLGLVNDILDFSKIEAGELHLASEVTDLQGKLDDIKQVMDVVATQKGVRLEIYPLPADMLVHYICDPLRLRQILINLVGNALKFTHQGHVTVQVQALPGAAAGHQRLRFEVIDTGIGIAQEDQDKLFTRFSQVDDGKTRRYGGTGLGLAIVKELAERMGGQVDVRSQLGLGSTFGVEVELKLASPTEIEQARLSQEQASVEESQSMQLDGLRILVVDDSETNRDIAEQLLTLEGAQVVTRNDGLQALEFLHSDEPLVDTVLMDVQMPVMDGNTAIACIRQDARLQALPVITMTAGATRSERELSMHSGANDYVTKPFELRYLIRTIRRQVELQRGQALQMGRPRTLAEPGQAAADPREWPELDGIDMASARQLMNHDWGTYTRHARRFLRDHAPYAQLHQWPESPTARASMVAALHKIAGEAGLLGAMALTRCARQAEQSARQSEPGDMSAVLQAFYQEMQRFATALAPALSASAAPASDLPAAAAALDRAEFQAMLEDLGAQRFKAFKRFRGLQAALATHLPAHDLAALAQAMENMDFAKAKTLLADRADGLLALALS